MPLFPSHAGPPPRRCPATVRLPLRASRVHRVNDVCPARNAVNHLRTLLGSGTTFEGMDFLPWAILAVAVIVLLLVDLKLFARGREPSFREGALWSVVWLVLSLAAVLVIWPLRGGDDAIEYLTVYLVERSLSLDNLFVFLLLFAYFAIPTEQRPRLLFWGIVAALVMRGLAILG